MSINLKEKIGNKQKKMMNQKILQSTQNQTQTGDWSNATLFLPQDTKERCQESKAVIVFGHNSQVTRDFLIIYRLIFCGGFVHTYVTIKTDHQIIIFFVL